MGTSTARRAPSTRAWRLAKGAATRYLSPESATPVEVREVLSRYVAALEEGSDQEGGGTLAAFRLTRKMGQNLGDFFQQVKDQDWQMTLRKWGLGDLASEPPEVAAHGLAAIWLPQTSGLEEAAVRPALVDLLSESLDAFITSPERPPFPETSHVVKRFIAGAFYYRLVFDLGEPMEAAAAGWRPFSAGLAEIKAEITRTVEAVAPEAPTPADWHGLEGWLWVTRVMQELLGQFSEKNLTHG